MLKLLPARQELVLFTGLLQQNWLHKSFLKVPLHDARLVALESFMFLYHRLLYKGLDEDTLDFFPLKGT